MIRLYTCVPRRLSWKVATDLESLGVGERGTVLIARIWPEWLVL